MINIIYGLRDPRNDVYQYVGKSTVGSSRALQHLTKSHSNRVNDWVKKLEDEWLYPIVDIIEEVSNMDDLPEREKYWVNYYYSINPDLLNIQLVDAPLQNLRTHEDQTNFDFLVRTITDIPKILRKERLYRNLTQQEMANHMGVHRGTIVACENGGNIGFDVIQKYILSLVGIDIIKKSCGERTRRVLTS